MVSRSGLQHNPFLYEELGRILFSEKVILMAIAMSLKPSSPSTAAGSMPGWQWATAQARLQPGAATAHRQTPGVRKRTGVISFEYGFPEAG
jgi:hypothetical protein